MFLYFIMFTTMKGFVVSIKQVGSSKVKVILRGKFVTFLLVRTVTWPRLKGLQNCFAEMFASVRQCVAHITSSIIHRLKSKVNWLQLYSACCWDFKVTCQKYLPNSFNVSWAWNRYVAKRSRLHIKVNWQQFLVSFGLRYYIFFHKYLTWWNGWLRIFKSRPY